MHVDNPVFFVIAGISDYFEEKVFLKAEGLMKSPGSCNLGIFMDVLIFAFVLWVAVMLFIGFDCLYFPFLIVFLNIVVAPEMDVVFF